MTSREDQGVPVNQTFLARHPVPYLGTTRRSKAPQRFVDRITTPVRLRACDPKEIPFAFGLPRDFHGDDTPDLPIHARKGGLWAAFPSRGGLSSRGTFAAFLEGALDETLAARPDPAVSDLLCRTPLQSALRQYNVSTTLGAAVVPADLRAVNHRDDAGAAAALQDFLNHRVVLTGEHAFVRVRGPMAIHRWGNTYGLSFFPANQVGNRETPVRIDEVRRHFEWHRTRPLIPKFEINPGRLDPRLTWVDQIALPEDLTPGDDNVWLAANEMPDIVNHLVERTLTAPLRREFADVIARSRLDALRGAIGAIDGADAFAVLARTRDFTGAVAERIPTGEMAHLHHYLDWLLLPGAASPVTDDQFDEGDVDALSRILEHG